MEKITYIAAIDTAINAMIEQGTSVEFIEKMQALRGTIEKRNNKPNKPTKKERENKEANAQIAEIVKQVLAGAVEPMTITAMRETNADLAELSPQKVSAVVRDLLKSGEVVRDTVKSKAVFKLA